MSFTVYRSSAGSGKTFTLVREYLKIILKEPSGFRNILAITFTNKAANEMRERILKALDELSVGEKSSAGNRILLPMLAGDLGMTETEISRNASLARQMILHNYADFAISTIDGFSHKLIRAFAHDFGLPVNFSVELDSDELLATAIDLLLDKVGDDSDLTNLLVNFLETRIEEEKGLMIESILAEFAGILLDEEGQAGIAKLKKYSLENFRAITTQLYTDIKLFEKKIREMAAEAVAMIRDRDIPVSAFSYGDKGIGQYFINLAAGLMDKMDPNSYVRRTIEEGKWYSGKVTAAEMASIDAVRAGLEQVYGRIAEEINGHKPEYVLRKLIAKTIYPVAVLNEIDRVLSEFKKQNNLVHISEFNSKIAGIVMNEPVPFIYERLGEKYHHLFIDEFQDTSCLQWMNHIPLIENALSGGYFNLVVGDGKQAIYRWRNGDVEQFNALPAIPGSDGSPLLRQREAVLKAHYQPAVISRNFRSKAEIVDFNNKFFRTVSKVALSGGREKIYDDLEQDFDPSGTGGFVTIEFLEKSPETEYREKTLERVLEIIRQAAVENFRFSDISVLCRSNTQASLVAAWLVEHGIEVVSAESLLVNNSPAVRFIIACLRFLYDPPNEIVKAEIRHFAGSRASEDIFRTETSRRLAMLPIYDLCETLIREFNLNTLPDEYLQFFLDAVLRFSGKVTTGGGREFLEWWERNFRKISIQVPEGLDAVRVMTIHKAKGLQFQYVILPFAGESRKNTRTYLWANLDPAVASGLESTILRSDTEMESTVYQDKYLDERQKSMLDMVNLLYVAMTRPVERLHILSPDPGEKDKSPDSWPDFFRYYIREQGVANPQITKYEFGTRAEHKGKNHEQKVEVIELNELISSDWNKNITIREHAPYYWDPDNPAAGPHRGNQLHTLLSRIRSRLDAAQVLEEALISGFVEADQLEEYRQLIDNVIKDPKLSPLFSENAKVITEAELLLPDGSFYRPDRVVFNEDGITIIDYKTGAPRDEHSRQLLRYAEILLGMDYKTLNPLLVYLYPKVEVINIKLK